MQVISIIVLPSIKCEDLVMYVPFYVLKRFSKHLKGKPKEVYLKISLVKIKIDDNMDQDWERIYILLYDSFT